MVYSRAAKKPARGTKRPRTTSRAPVRRANSYIRRGPSLTSDQTITVSTYCEVHATTSALSETEMSYSIRLDPKALQITTNDLNVTLTDGSAGEGTLLASGASFNLPKFTTMKELFNQYNVRSASVSVQASRNSSEFPLIFSKDIGDATPCTSTLNAVSGAHKTEYITESRRMVRYGTKHTGQQLDYQSTQSSTETAPDSRSYIKVFQHLPKTADLIVSHGVTVYLTLGLKDSRHLN